MQKEIVALFLEKGGPVLCAIVCFSNLRLRMPAVPKSNMYSFVKTSTDPLLYWCEAFASIRPLLLNFKPYREADQGVFFGLSAYICS